MISAAGAKGDKLGVGAEMRLEGLGLCHLLCHKRPQKRVWRLKPVS